MSDDRTIPVPEKLLVQLRADAYCRAQELLRLDAKPLAEEAMERHEAVRALLVQPVTEEPAEQQPCAGEQHRHKAWVDKYAAHVCVDCHWLIDPNGEALSSLPFEAAWIDTRASR